MRKTKKQEDFESTLEFHRDEWRIQRIGWALLAAFLLLAAAGLFGGGPLSHTRAGNERDGKVEYDRFVRAGARTKLTVTPAPAAKGDATLIEIPASYLQAFRVEQVMPEPNNVRRYGERLVYEFASQSPGAPIVFYLQPEELGRHAVQLAIDAGRPVTLSQFTYP